MIASTTKPSAGFQIRTPTGSLVCRKAEIRTQPGLMADWASKTTNSLPMPACVLIAAIQPPDEESLFHLHRKGPFVRTIA